MKTTVKKLRSMIEGAIYNLKDMPEVMPTQASASLVKLVGKIADNLARRNPKLVNDFGKATWAATSMLKNMEPEAAKSEQEGMATNFLDHFGHDIYPVDQAELKGASKEELGKAVAEYFRAKHGVVRENNVKASYTGLQRMIKEAVEEAMQGSGLVDLVHQAVSMVTHDDPNTVGSFYRDVRASRRIIEDSPEAEQEELENLAAQFIGDMTSEDEVSPNDGETPRMSPDQFNALDQADLGRAVLKAFER